MRATDDAPGRRAVLGAALAALSWAAAEAASGAAAGGAGPAHPLVQASEAGKVQAPPSPVAGTAHQRLVLAPGQRPGITGSEVASKRSTAPQLEGFLGQHASTAQRRKVDVYINSTLGSIRIKAYRIGNYNGDGQRLVWTSEPVRVRRQPAFTLQRKTRMVSCPWHVTTTVNTTGWPDGFYYLVLTDGSRREHRIPLIVESASVVGKAVLVFNDCTMQAYNKWGGYSLYTGPNRSTATRSYKVSFDRPYRNFNEVELRNAPLVRAAEAIDDPALKLAYTTEARISRNPALVSGAAAVVFAGHSEYWSPSLRRTIEGARDKGTNIVFFGANNVYWRTRLESSFTGTNRVLVCYRKARLDPYRRRHPEAVTTQWRQGPVSKPESTLTGSVYGDLGVKGTFTVTDPSFFAFAGTGAVRGATYPGLTAGETDRVFPATKRQKFRYPKTLRIFAHSPASGTHASHGWSDSTFYTAPSGAWVLNMGTLDWLQAQGDGAVPARSRAFARQVTQNIIREAAREPFSHHSPRRGGQTPHRASAVWG
ncbi:N,N-dimethylformamidase beta subunit family domain-containing protein [Arthrobacter sp. C9C5]|uniref:N,N-dimethylformamidase beta subunit family domain-containing protein n=1 Tax=Arthrobacter sp. C9C5 TaxID=2735267 RepID=UPI0015848867|nr:N,N-dimethylformamidase beta subunit family domain-containing protein [Arthrobacter sp. C9C5]NUU33206.1 hypothetical protein [Arthrobacter sp. C9C5]